MVKALFRGLLALTMCAFASAAAVPPVLPQKVQRSLNNLLTDETDIGADIFLSPKQLHHPIRAISSSATTTLPTSFSSSRPTFEEDDPSASVRSERSTNLSFISAGAARKIQMFIKNRHLQLLPDGTVNGTTDDSSIYTILQRVSVGIGQLKIQGVATCQYLCMDSCGHLYGSREFVDECIFNEMIEQHHYNTYSSTKYSNERRTLYLAFNKKGQPRKVLLRARQQLGRLSSFTRVITRIVPPERMEELHPLRHHGGHLCPSSTSSSTTQNHSHSHNQSSNLNSPTSHLPRCRKRKKKKKKKRKCSPEGEEKGQHMVLCTKLESQNAAEPISPKNNSSSSNFSSSISSDSNKCVSGNNNQCQSIELSEKKRQKTLNNGIKKKKQTKGTRGKKMFSQNRATSSSTTSTTTITTTSLSPSTSLLDEDYAGEATTFLEYEYSTVTDSAVFPQPD